MTDYRKPRHDERLAPCPICGQEPWADSKNGTIFCECGLRLHLNGNCSPEWHRMDWTAQEWNGIAKLKEENAKLRELATSAMFMLVNDNPCGGCDFADECDEQWPNGSCLMKDELQRIAERLGIDQ